MHLKSLTLKGFKSFPDRTRLEFGPGVSVVVGPNGSGKSNVTDAVLWAMGEQSPLAVRGQSMQDVIFGGGRGVQPRSAAEVEIVLDNSDGTVELPVSEISIVRRLERNGEGGYRLNGARCRLVDVIEVLSDTGLGKESHSVISQGRVDAIVTSRPRERRLLIEEAAGLGKHRKRRRRAQLKLERTQENLDRALDIEREARSRLRPLKRQAEAAELHERLERQILQARLGLARELVRVRRGELAAAEQAAAATRSRLADVQSALEGTIRERGAAERMLSERADRHDALAQRAYRARSARERLELRAEQVLAAGRDLERRRRLAAEELSRLTGPEEPAGAATGEPAPGRIPALERQLGELNADRERELELETASLRAELERERRLLAAAEAELGQARQAGAGADAEAQAARQRLADAEHAAQEARREAERIGAELAAVNHFLRAHARYGAGEGATKALGEELRVADGYELALAAVLGGRLDAALVDDLAGAHAVLDRAGPDGGSALLAGPGAPSPPGPSGPAGEAPTPDARRLLELVSGPAAVMDLARRLLGDAWVVEDIDRLRAGFRGIAATRGGRVLFAPAGEIRQLAAGGAELVLARRNERDRLVSASERAAQAEHAARATRDEALERLGEAEGSADAALERVRTAERSRGEAAERVRQREWLIEQRRQAPGQGALAVRIAELEGELSAERRQAERLERERLERAARVQWLRSELEAVAAAEPLTVRLRAAIAAAAEAVAGRAEGLERELAEDRRAGEQMAATLRECAARESELQTRLRASGEEVTAAEVAAQRTRDLAGEAELELAAVAERLEVEPAEGEEPAGELSAEAQEELRGRVERLTRRREQLGPVNPLAQDEYGEALAHVQELEGQRADLETALRELRSVIRDTDREIEETFERTFEAAARNFEQLVQDVFPGGSGRLRLVREERLPRAVLGGQPLGEGEPPQEAAEQAADAEEERLSSGDGEELPGVEIEVTPAGKATKRLSLLSGGEKSMTALAFLFAVFLARPCPFYILDEVEAALDDLNLDRFLTLLRRHCDRAQFIVITHQRRTMEAADWLYGVSMGADGVSKVISRRLPPEQGEQPQPAPVAGAA